MLGLKKNGKSWKDVMSKECELSVINWGKFIKIYAFRFLSVSLLLGMRRASLT